jgi:hypothetical protein
MANGLKRDDLEADVIEERDESQRDLQSGEKRKWGLPVG